MCKLNPKHKKCVHVENGVKVLYICLLKDIYGCMESAILCYDLYSKTLKSQGFLINPYYRFIANSTIKDKQCTIVWFFDNNKVPYADEEVNTNLIEKKAKIFLTSQY